MVTEQAYGLFPFCFVLVLGLGGGIGLAGVSLDWAVNLPLGWLFSLVGIEAAPVEVVILMSMVVLGLIIMSQACHYGLAYWLWPSSPFIMDMPMVEMGNKGALGYFSGFMLASAVIHVLGVVVGKWAFFSRTRARRARWQARCPHRRWRLHHVPGVWLGLILFPFGCQLAFVITNNNQLAPRIPVRIIIWA